MLNTIIISTLVPLSLFSYELNFSKKFSQVVNPDILTTRISANIQNKDERFISDNLESINDHVKESKDIKYKHGSFNLTPRYSYKNNKRKFIGYAGHLSYIITSKNANSMNEFISELIEVKEKLEVNSLKLNINNTTWKVSDELQQKSLDNLRLKAIKWISSYANKLDRSCTIKKINIGSRNSHYPSPMNSSVLRSMSVNVAPSKSIQSIYINPNFTLECK